MREIIGVLSLQESLMLITIPPTRLQDIPLHICYMDSSLRNPLTSFWGQMHQISLGLKWRTLPNQKQGYSLKNLKVSGSQQKTHLGVLRRFLRIPITIIIFLYHF